MGFTFGFFFGALAGWIGCAVMVMARNDEYRPPPDDPWWDDERPRCPGAAHEPCDLPAGHQGPHASDCKNRG